MEDGTIQVSAPSVEQAIERGLAQLGLTAEEVTVQIVDEGSRGILGLGARDALVHLKPIDIVVEMEPEEDTKDILEHEPEEQSQDEYAVSEEQVREISQQTLLELLNKMGIECRIEVREDAELEDEPAPVTLDVLGDGLDILIGRQGQVLNALQFITRLIVSREVEHWVNLVVDVEKYKQRRAKSLKQLAERIAERVARTRQPVALEPMPPNERRVIHLALRSHPTVTTQSVGKGESRKVTIIPRA